jgi:hypothetical protein
MAKDLINSKILYGMIRTQECFFRLQLSQVSATLQLRNAVGVEERTISGTPQSAVSAIQPFYESRLLKQPFSSSVFTLFKEVNLFNFEVEIRKPVHHMPILLIYKGGISTHSENDRYIPRVASSHQGHVSTKH